MEIHDNNFLIATFSGGGRTPDVVACYDERWVKHIGTSYKDSGIEQIEDLRYHSSWDWLMIIVNKIRTTEHISKGYNVIIENNKTTISDIHNNLVCEFKSEDSLLNTYNCVVQFIKLYNINRNK